MEIIKYIFLGILQGITEPLPISSSGHIYLFKKIFHTSIFNDLNLEIFLNFASFVAIIYIFRHEVIKVFKDSFNYLKTKEKKYKEGFNYLIKIVISTIPVAILGLLIKDYLEVVLSKNIFLIGFGFLITGLALLAVTNSNGKKKDDDITIRDAVIIGLFQAIALVPGISRSGMTLVACLLMGLDKKTSLKYTFMLYFPVSLGTMLIGVKDFVTINFSLSMMFYYAIGMIAAGILTYLSYNWLSKLVENKKLWKFSVYLFAVAIFTIMFFI